MRALLKVLNRLQHHSSCSRVMLALSWLSAVQTTNETIAVLPFGGHWSKEVGQATTSSSSRGGHPTPAVVVSLRESESESPLQTKASNDISYNRRLTKLAGEPTCRTGEHGGRVPPVGKRSHINICRDVGCPAGVGILPTTSEDFQVDSLHCQYHGGGLCRLARKDTLTGSCVNWLGSSWCSARIWILPYEPPI